MVNGQRFPSSDVWQGETTKSQRSSDKDLNVWSGRRSTDRERGCERGAQHEETTKEEMLGWKVRTGCE